jgi:hypothetical protein
MDSDFKNASELITATPNLENCHSSPRNQSLSLELSGLRGVVISCSEQLC